MSDPAKEFCGKYLDIYARYVKGKNIPDAWKATSAQYLVELGLWDQNYNPTDLYDPRKHYDLVAFLHTIGDTLDNEKITSMNEAYQTCLEIVKKMKMKL